MKYGWNQFFSFVYAINRALSTNESHFHLLIGAQAGDSSGMSETDKTSQPRALAMGDGLSLTPRKASG